MKTLSLIALASFLVLGIASQVQASENKSTVSLELENQKYMMSAHLSNNEGYPPSRNGGRRGFAENYTLNSEDNSILPARGSGR